MKIKIVFIIVAFKFIGAIGQIKQGKIVYKKEFISKTFVENDDNLASFAKFKMIEEKMIETLKELEFELNFKEQQSDFKFIKSLELEGNKFATLALHPDGNKVFYTDNELRISETNIFGEDFLVTDEKLNWELKNETKKIGKYTCNKAIAIETLLYKGKMKEYPIIAWYCPTINVPFGPIGISGLPGLILQVDKGTIRYTAIKVNLNTKEEINIKKLTKGKKVTRKKMGEMIGEAMGSFKKNKGY